MVRVAGLEPATTGPPALYATNCATPCLIAAYLLFYPPSQKTQVLLQEEDERTMLNLKSMVGMASADFVPIVYRNFTL